MCTQTVACNIRLYNGNLLVIPYLNFWFPWLYILGLHLKRVQKLGPKYQIFASLICQMTILNQTKHISMLKEISEHGAISALNLRSVTFNHQ